jgi:pimeloyl-ACP methyl ester carboxylesterase
VTSSWVTVAGGKIFVQITGDGPPVLLINGIGASHAMWEPMVAGLQGLEVIAFDAPGVGRSEPRCLPYSVRALGQQIRELLDKLGRPHVDVVGYSFGGAVAQELARQAPDTVRRLVLAGAACGWGGLPGTPAALAVLSMPLRYYSRSFYEATAGALAGGQAERDPAFIRRAGEARLRYPPSLAGYAAQLAAIGRWTSLPWLHTLEHPTLAVHGEDDPVVPPANGMLLANRLPNARFRLQPREGHFLLLDPDSSAIPSVRDFLCAPNYRTSRTWRDAREIDEHRLSAAIRATRGSAQPFAAASALMRVLTPMPVPPA